MKFKTRAPSSIPSLDMCDWSLIFFFFTIHYVRCFMLDDIPLQFSSLYQTLRQLYLNFHLISFSIFYPDQFRNKYRHGLQPFIGKDVGREGKEGDFFSCKKDDATGRRGTCKQRRPEGGSVRPPPSIFGKGMTLIPTRKRLRGTFIHRAPCILH